MMATAEQMQEAFQQQQHDLQVLTARMAAMETQLQFETARAHHAEQERSMLIGNLGSMRMNGLTTKCGRSCLQGSEMTF